MKLPKPEAGLVICYSYLWLREHQAGREEGIKDRPCAVVLASEDRHGETEVLVVPVTHSPPDKGAAALEIPQALKRHLGLDSDRSWVIYSESNAFAWPGLGPGPDLRPVSARKSSITYGILPAKFFGELKRRFLASETAARSTRIRRSE